MKNKVFLVADDNYAEQLAATINSILANTSSPGSIEILVIDGGIKKDNKTKILSIFRNYPAKIEFLKIDLEKYKKMKKIGHLGLTTYYRLEIPSFFKNDKVAYLDCDVIVKEDICKLFKISLDNKTIGAVKDYFINLVGGERYFNAGVMLIDCKRWNKKNYSKKFFEWHDNNFEKIRFADQCVLNGILDKDWKSIPLRWNRQRIMLELTPRRMHLSKGEYESLRENPGIIHYTGRVKPWHKRYIFQDKGEYEKYAQAFGKKSLQEYSIADRAYRLIRKLVQVFKLRYFLETNKLVPELFLK